jgi:glycosyltransferase involved in cell wall biosynthesis
VTGAPVGVAHVITRFDVGGAQETALRVCAGLDRERFDPVLLTGPDAGSGGSLREEAEQRGVEVVVVPALHGPIRPWSDRQAVEAVAKVLRARKVRVVQTHSSKAGVVGRVAAGRAKVDVVVHTVHGWSFNDTQSPTVAAAYRWIERALARRTDALVVVTNADRDLGLRWKIGRPEQYALVRSGIRLDEAPTRDRDAVRAELGWGKGEVVVVSVGRLEAQKDPLTLVRAVAAARRTVPSLRLALVGGGSLADEVEAAVADAGLTGRVDLLGLRTDVPDLLGAADIFALSSRFEGLPRAVLEAVRAGLPVVATDTGGVGEVVADRVSGCLVPIGDAAAMGRAITKMATDPHRAASYVAEARARLPQFTEARMVADTEALYDRLLAARPRRRWQR